LTKKSEVYVSSFEAASLSSTETHSEKQNENEEKVEMNLDLKLGQVITIIFLYTRKVSSTTFNYYFLASKKIPLIAS
jgi:hypothetical protein